MAKQNLGKNFNIYPMPVVIVGTVTDGKPNFMTAAWLTKLNTEPPLVGVSLGLHQHTATRKTRPRTWRSSRGRWNRRPWCGSARSRSSAA